MQAAAARRPPPAGRIARASGPGRPAIGEDHRRKRDQEGGHGVAQTLGPAGCGLVHGSAHRRTEPPGEPGQLDHRQSADGAAGNEAPALPMAGGGVGDVAPEQRMKAHEPPPAAVLIRPWSMIVTRSLQARARRSPSHWALAEKEARVMGPIWGANGKKRGRKPNSAIRWLKLIHYLVS